MIKRIPVILVLLLVVACQRGPRAINYGEDSCHFCSMTIVDKQHAAQIVTRKGKVYNFDAAECMIQSLPEFEQKGIGHYLVTDYETPEKLIDATQAVFIVSPEIPSPMRANLAALKSRESAVVLQESKTGQLYSWQQIQLHLKKD